MPPLPASDLTPLPASDLTQLRQTALRPNERNRVRIARGLAHITQAELFRQTGVLQAQISQLELGQYRDVTLKTATRLARFFGCTIEDLFPLDLLLDGEPTAPAAGTPTTEPASC